MSGALVVAETVIGETQCLREHPAFAVVLGEEGLDALLAVATSILNLRFQVVKGDERQDGVTELGVLVSVNASCINFYPSTRSPHKHKAFWSMWRVGQVHRL